MLRNQVQLLSRRVAAAVPQVVLTDRFAATGIRSPGREIAVFCNGLSDVEPLPYPVRVPLKSLLGSRASTGPYTMMRPAGVPNQQHSRQKYQNGRENHQLWIRAAACLIQSLASVNA